ncbi:MAG: hypothetical protein ACOYD4_17845, partial [Solirubrobacterales bacterium]
ASARRAGDTAPSGGDKGETASEEDVVTIAVQPDDPPIGARIETLTGAGKINIAGADVPGTGAGQFSYAALDRATREVLASGSTAATPAGLQAVEKAFEKWQEPRYMVIVSSNKGVDPAALPALQKLLTAIGASPLGPRDRRQILFSEGEPYAFSAIGYPGSPTGSAFVNVGRQQVPSARPGDIGGYLQLNPYMPPPSSPSASQPASLYGYVNGGEPAFDTRAGGSGDSNTMIVAGQAIEAEMFDDVPAGSSGFHLVALDPSSLELLPGGEDEFNQIFATNTGNLAADQATTHSLAERAQAVIAGNDLLLLQSIGHPKPTTPAWSQLIEVVAKAGGTPALIGGLDGSGGYAVIGSGGENQVQAIETAQSTTSHFAVLFRGAGTDTIFPTAGPARAIEQKLEQLSSIGAGNVKVTWDAPAKSWDVEFMGDLGSREWPLMALSPGHPSKETAPTVGLARAGGLPPGYPQAETSEKLTHRPARLTGFLSRDHDFDYRPTLAGNAAIPGGGLVELAYGPGKPFPPFASAGEKAGDRYIADKLNLVDTSDVRANYYKDFEANWGVKLTSLGTLCPTSPKGFTCEGQGFSEAEFEHVRTQLQSEIPKLTEIQGLIAHLQAPFDKNKTDAYVNLVDISQKISEGVGPPDVSTSVIAAGILSHMFGAAAGGLEGPAETAASMLGEGLSKAGEQLRPNGSPILAELHAKTTALSLEVLERYNEASASLSQLGLILASDYGKMTAVSERVRGAWHWLPASTETAQRALRKGTQRWFWTTLLPVAYRLWQIGPPDVDKAGVPKNAREYDCRNGGRFGMMPFQGDSDLVQDFGAVAMAPTGATVVPLKQLRALGEPSPNWDARDPDVHPPTETLVKPLFESLETPQGLGLHVPEFISSRYFTLAPGPFSNLHYGKECGT